MSSIFGSSRSSMSSERAISAPISTEVKSAIVKPARIRRTLAHKSAGSSALSVIRHSSANTALGGGRIWASTIPFRLTTSQMQAMAIGDNALLANDLKRCIEQVCDSMADAHHLRVFPAALARYVDLDHFTDR